METERKRKRAISATYTLKAIGEHAEKLLELKLIDRHDFEIIEQIQMQAIEKYIKK